MPNDKSKNLYLELSRRGYDTGASHADFEKSIRKSDRNRKWLYDVSKEEGLVDGDYDTFVKDIVSTGYGGSIGGMLDDAMVTAANKQREQEQPKPKATAKPKVEAQPTASVEETKTEPVSEQRVTNVSTNRPTTQATSKTNNQPVDNPLFNWGDESKGFLPHTLTNPENFSENYTRHGYVDDKGRETSIPTPSKAERKSDARKVAEREADNKYGATIRKLEKELQVAKNQGNQSDVIAKTLELNELKRRRDEVAGITSKVADEDTQMASIITQNALGNGSTNPIANTRNNAETQKLIAEDEYNAAMAQWKNTRKEEDRKEAVAAYKKMDAAYQNASEVTKDIEALNQYISNFGMPRDINDVPFSLRKIALESFPQLADGKERVSRIVKMMGQRGAMSPDQIAELATQIGNDVDTPLAIAANTDPETIKQSLQIIEDRMALMQPDINARRSSEAATINKYGASMDPSGRYSAGAMVASERRIEQDNPSYFAYQQAANALNKSLIYQEMAKKIKPADGFFDSQNWYNIGQGAKEAVKEFVSNPFGITEALNMDKKMGLFNRVNSGGPISIADQTALNSMAMESICLDKFGSYLENGGFAAGNTGVQSLELVAEMCLLDGVNVLYRAGDKMMAEAGKKALEQYGKTTLRNLAQKAAAKLPGLAVRTIGAAGQSVLLSNTIQALDTYSSTLNKLMGTPDYTIKPDGSIVSNGFRDGKSLGRSLYESEVSAFNENFTEMAFDGLLGNVGKLGTSTLRSLKLGQIADFIDNLDIKFLRNRYSRPIAKLMESGHYGGLVGEMAEEYYGIAMEHLEGISESGKTLWEDLTDGENFMKIFGGLALSSAGLGILGTGHAAYRSAAFKRRANQAKNHFGDNWESIEKSILDAETNDLPGVMADLYQGMTDKSDREQLVKYYFELMKYRGSTAANARLSEDADNTNHKNAVESARANGYDETNANVIANGKRVKEALKQRWQEKNGTDLDTWISQIEESGMSFEEAIDNLGGLSQDDKVALYTYDKMKAFEQGHTERIEQERNANEAEAQAKIDSYADEEGNVTSAYTPDGKQVFVISSTGNGSIVADAETGEKTMVLTKALYNVTTVSAARMKDIVSQSETNDASDIEASTEPVQKPFNIGDTYSDSNTGNTIVINGVTEDGLIQYTLTDVNGESMVLTAVPEDVQTIVDSIKASETEASLNEQLEETKSEIEQQEGQSVPTIEESKQAILSIPGGEEVLAAVDNILGDEAYGDNFDDKMTALQNVITSYGTDFSEPILDYINAVRNNNTSDIVEPPNTAAETPVVQPSATEQPAYEYPRDNEGYIDYEQISDSQMMAAAKKEEFGDNALSNLNNDIEAIQKKSAKLEGKADTKSLREGNALGARLKVLTDARDILESEIRNVQTEETEQPIIAKGGEAAHAIWSPANKVVGHKSTKRLKDGRKVTGTYVAVEAGTAQASHDKDFKDNPNYVHDEQGRNVNTRDYTQKSNQDTEKQKAQNFQLHNPQVVSSDGIVYDGNGRQIAGDIAAANNTDVAYIEDLIDRADEFGLDAEQLKQMQHPRVYFMLDEGQLDYSPNTFDLFNIEDQKAAGSVETGVKMGKVLSDRTFKLLSDAINEVNGGLKGVYKSTPAMRTLIGIMQNAPDITAVGLNNRVEYWDEASGKLTEKGRNLLEACLVGHLFDGETETLQRLENLPNRVMNALAQAMPQLTANSQLGEYALTSELKDAIKAIYEARTANQSLDEFMSQYNIETGESGLNVYGETVSLFAKTINGDVDVELSDVLERYNKRATELVNGQYTLFDEPETREQLLNEILGINGKETEQGSAGEEAPTTESSDQGSEEQPAVEEPTVEEPTTGEQPTVEEPTTGEQPTVTTEKPVIKDGPTGVPEKPKKPKNDTGTGTKETETPKNDVPLSKPKKPGKGATRAEAQAYADATYGAGSAKAKSFMRMWEITNKKAAALDKSSTPSSSLFDYAEAVGTEEEITEEEANELKTLGVELGADFVRDGNVKFADFFNEMVLNFGDNIRPFTKFIYGGIANEIEDEFADQMDDRKTVREFDINTPVNEETDGEESNDNVLGQGAEATTNVDSGNEGAVQEGEGTTVGNEQGGTESDNGTSEPGIVSIGDEGTGTAETNTGEKGSTTESGTAGKPSSGSTSRSGDRGGKRERTNDDGGTRGSNETTDEPATNGDLGRDPVAEAEANAYAEERGVVATENNIDVLKSIRKQYKKALEGLTNAIKIAELKGKLKAVVERLRELIAAKPKSEDALQEKSPYVPASDPEGKHAIGSVVPSGAAGAMSNALARLAEEEGKPIQEYVKDELGYGSVNELMSDFANGKETGLASEQVDSVALAISAMKKGKGFIVGDMTGVGKGRQAAALIRWGVQHGKKVLYLTEKASLFSDMYRDLTDIGSANLLPFCVNSSADASITDADGRKIIERPNASAQTALWQTEGDALPNNKKGKKYDFMMMAYSQAGSAKTANAKMKLEWIRNYAKDAIIIMDESHNASGDSNIGRYFSDIVDKSAGVTFLSATYAKRPDNMMLYALKSSMGETNMTREDMIKAIESGGVPIQELLASNLFKSGEMVRRERDFSDVKTHWLDPANTYTPEENDRMRRTADKTMDVINAIIDFQRTYVNPIVKEQDQQFEAQNTINALTGGPITHAMNTAYKSQVSNILGLLVYGMKAKKAAEMAIQQLKEGKKPVIAVENTLGSYVSEIEDELKESNFRPVFEKGIKFALKYKVRAIDPTQKDEKGKPVVLWEQVYDAADELDQVGTNNLKFLRKLVNDYFNDPDIEKLSLSPIDQIKEMLAEQGYNCGEITGRTSQLVHTPLGTYEKRPLHIDGKKAALKFNGGSKENPLPKTEQYDALILNVAGATGISLHASKKFGNTEPRTMIILQPARNVNIEVQMRGRIDRTGQISRGEYFYLTSPIPAEQKLIMMLKQKLASLDANSVGTEDVSSNKVDSTDMDNKYGNQVATEFLKSRMDINTALDTDGLRFDNKTREWVPQDDQLYRVLIGMQRLDCETQEVILDELASRYTELIDYLNQNGINDLKTSSMNLEANTIDEAIFIKGSDNEADNEFAHDTNIERVEVNVLKQPLRSLDITKKMKKNGSLDSEGKGNYNYEEECIDKAKSKRDSMLEERGQKHQEKREKLLNKLREANPIDSGETEEDYNNRLMKMPEYIELDDKLNTEYKNFDAEMSAQIGTVNFVMTNLEPGKPYLVPLTDDISSDAPVMYARFIGYQMKDGKPRNIQATFAVKDSRAIIDIPIISKEEAIRKIVRDSNYDMELQNIGGDQYDINISTETRRKAWDEWWDAMIPTNTTRQIRYMITGNVLQACGSLGKYKGTITTFTRKDFETGEITLERGMLLAEDFDPENFKIRSRVTKDDIWDNYREIFDSISNISAHREGDNMIVTFRKRKGEKLSAHKVNSDDTFKAFAIGGNLSIMRDSIEATIPEEYVDQALEHLYKEYGFTNEHLLVLPDSTDKPDAIVYTDKPYQDVIDEFEPKYQTYSHWDANSKIKDKLKRLKMDVNNEKLKDEIRELVQLRQAYLRKRYAQIDTNRLAWEALIEDEAITAAGDDKGQRESHYNKKQAMLEELKARGISGTAMHLEQGETTLAEVKKLFDSLNTNKKNKELFDKVFAKVKDLDMHIVLSEKISSNIGGAAAGNYVEYNWKYFNSDWITDQMKADTILHELIHTTTVYAVYCVENDMEHLLDQEMIDSVNELKQIYAEIKNDDDFQVDGIPDYGVTNVKEMLSEAGSNETFRTHLKKAGLWAKLKSAILMFFGVKKNPSLSGGKLTNAYDEIMSRLEYLIENFNTNAWRETYKGSRYGAFDYSKADKTDDFAYAKQIASNTRRRFAKSTSNNSVKVSEDTGRITDKTVIKKEVENAAKKLNVQVEVVDDITGLSDALRKKVEAEKERSRNSNGRRNRVPGLLYNGKVYITLSECTDVSDALKTVLHEVVGHKGLRELIGNDQYNKVILGLYDMLSKVERDTLDSEAEKNGWSRIKVMDEWLAKQAETGKDYTLFDRGAKAFIDFFRGLHIPVRLTGADVRYLLWRSRKKLSGDDYFDAATDVLMREATRKYNESNMDVLRSLYENALEAWSNKDVKGKVVFTPSERARKKLDELLGHDVNNVVITNDAIRHIKNHHGENESARGQIDMTPSDVAMLPYLIDKFDSMELSPENDDKMGNKAVTIKKRINGTSYIGTIEKGKDKSFVVTSWKHISSNASDALDANATSGLYVRNDSEDFAKVKRDVELTKKTVEYLNDINNSDPIFKLREKAAPKNTGVGYKVFVLKNGKLYPPKVANPGGAETPVGVWLDADAAPIVGQSKTGRNKVKSGGKGTQGGGGTLAYRPGWHLGTIPYALQFNRKNEATGERELFPNDFVWAEVEYAKDVDYQDEAMSYGYNEAGNFQHSLAGLPRIPEDGSYMYRTNPDPRTDEWVISGAMKVNRILTPTEVDDMVRAAGREPQLRQEGAVTDAQVDELNNQYGLTDDISFRSVDDNKGTDIQRAWHDIMRRWKTQAVTVMFDNLHPLRKFQELIQKTFLGKSKRLADFENAYQAMISLGGLNNAHIDEFDRRFVKPLDRALIRLIGNHKIKMDGKDWDWKNDKVLRPLTNYIITKHGIERNRDMAVRAALKGDDDIAVKLDQFYQDLEAIRSDDTKYPTWREKQEAMDYVAENIGADLTKEYSGLGVLYDEAIAPVREQAYDEVEMYENEHDTRELWDALQNMSSFILVKQNEGGLTSKQYLDTMSRRWEYYVPLRGFDKTMAEDIYEYKDNGDGMGNPLKKARGRQSLSDNPLANMIALATQSIVISNKNSALQKFYNMIRKYPSDLAKIVNHWEVKDTSGNWEVAEPQLFDTDNAEEIARVLDDFEAEMKAKEVLGEARKVRSKKGTLPYEVKNERHLDKHEIHVSIAGKKVSIFVAGDPDVVMSLRGEYKPEPSNGVLQQIQRWRAGLLTSYNASFATRNLRKDSQFSALNTFVQYAKFGLPNGVFSRYMWHRGLIFPGALLQAVRIGKMLVSYRSGKTAKSTSQRLFNEFMHNGGATGFTLTKDLEESRKTLEAMFKEMRRKAWNPKTWFPAVKKFIELITNASELVNRFAIYQAVREKGGVGGGRASITRAIAAAKNVSINFELKGAGKAFVGNQKRASGIKALAGLTSFGQNFMMFFNANMQGKYQMYRLFKDHPVKAATGFAIPAALHGYALVQLNNIILPFLYEALGMGGGDDEDYYDLGDYDRQNYICIRLPKSLGGGWLKLPESPEITPVATIADKINLAMTGQREMEADDITDAMNLMLPNAWNYSNLVGGKNREVSVAGREIFSSTPVSPLVDIALNRNFMGSRIYKENSNSPSHMNGTRRTSKTMNKFAEYMNTATGGNELMNGMVPINPGILQHLVEGYTGGYGSTSIAISDVVLSFFGDEEEQKSRGLAWEKAPFVSGFFKSGTGEARADRLERKYYNDIQILYDEQKKMENKLNKLYQEDPDFNKVMRIEDQLKNDTDFKIYLELKASGVVEYIKELEKITEDENETLEMKKQALDLLKEMRERMSE